MANSDIRKFKLNTDMERYTWLVNDMANLQQWLTDNVRGLAEGAFGVGVLTGLTWTPLSGLTVRVAPGIAITPDGRLMVNPANKDVTFTSPIGNPAKSLLVMRPLDTDTASIPKPLNPLVNIFRETIQGMDIVALNGTPGVSPAYPALGASDCRLAGFSLTAGQVTISQGNLDPDQRDVPVCDRRRITRITANYTVLPADNLIEISAAGGNVTVTLPNNLANIWREIRFLRTDSSANTVTIAPAGSDTIIGDGSFTLDAQWMKAILIANGLGDWRMF